MKKAEKIRDKAGSDILKNTLAYYDRKIMTAVKSFFMLAPVSNVLFGQAPALFTNR
jgi:hypothetical protein